MFRRMTCAAAALAATLALTAPAALADADHRAMPMTTHQAGKGMSVQIAVTRDPMTGFNLQVRTRGFRWAPDHASSKHRSGEGHAHLYLDGKKTTRLYGSWFFLGMLTPGRHEIRVTLNGNDHGDYVRGGTPVAASAVVRVPAA